MNSNVYELKLTLAKVITEYVNANGNGSSLHLSLKYRDILPFSNEFAFSSSRFFLVNIKKHWLVTT